MRNNLKEKKKMNNTQLDKQAPQPTYTQYNNFSVIYTVDQLIQMNKIRIPGPDSFRRDKFELPDTILMHGISEFKIGVFNEGEQETPLQWFPIYYKKVRLTLDSTKYVFYILDDLVKDKLNEYCHPKDKNDNTILEMLKKYKYIKEKNE